MRKAWSESLESQLQALKATCAEFTGDSHKPVNSDSQLSSTVSKDNNIPRVAGWDFSKVLSNPQAIWRTTSKTKLKAEFLD